MRRVYYGAFKAERERLMANQSRTTAFLALFPRPSFSPFAPLPLPSATPSPSLFLSLRPASSPLTSRRLLSATPPCLFVLFPRPSSSPPSPPPSAASPITLPLFRVPPAPPPEVSPAPAASPLSSPTGPASSIAAAAAASPSSLATTRPPAPVAAASASPSVMRAPDSMRLLLMPPLYRSFSRSLGECGPSSIRCRSWRRAKGCSAKTRLLGSSGPFARAAIATLSGCDETLRGAC